MKIEIEDKLHDEMKREEENESCGRSLKSEYEALKIEKARKKLI